MVNSAYITFDSLDKASGAGQVCINEIDALREATTLRQVLTKAEIGANIDSHYAFNPFLFDYFASLLIKEEGVDIAHLSCSPANAILSKLRPRRYVVNCPAHALEESIREHEELTGEPYPYAHNTDPYLRDTLWRHLKEADAVITPSNASRDWIQDNIKPKRVVVIPHGVDYPLKPRYPEKFGNVGYIGAWGPDKGLKYLIQAWSRLNYPDSTLMFFGRDAERAEPFLRHFARGGRYNLYGGFNNLDEIMPLFSVYVHPSVSEGYGITVPEAMSYGKVVVASTGTGSSMLIEDGVNGFTFKPRDVEALAARIDDLHLNFKDYVDVGKKARETVWSITWDKVKGQYRKLYEEIIS